MIDVPKVSYSAKFLYEWCPRQYRYVRVERYTPDYPPRISTIVGKAVHRVINKMYLEEQFSLDYLLQTWPSYFYGYTKREQFRFKSKEQEIRWLNIGSDLLTKFHVLASKEGLLVKPIKTEWQAQVEVETKSGRKFLIKVVVDLVIKVGEKVYIVDFKTGWFQVTDEELSRHDQLTLYSLAVRRILGLVESNVGLFYMRHGVLRWSTRSEADYERCIAEIEADWEKIERREFAPTYQRCFLCQYRKRCKSEDLAAATGINQSWFHWGGVKT